MDDLTNRGPPLNSNGASLSINWLVPTWALAEKSLGGTFLDVLPAFDYGCLLWINWFSLWFYSFFMACSTFIVSIMTVDARCFLSSFWCEGFDCRFDPIYRFEIHPGLLFSFFLNRRRIICLKNNKERYRTFYCLLNIYCRLYYFIRFHVYLLRTTHFTFLLVKHWNW